MADELVRAEQSDRDDGELTRALPASASVAKSFENGAEGCDVLISGYQLDM